jgi:large subunit ribosomal protein L27
MGRDHTIYATESGYVKYYKDPEKNPKRQYIGVVFERDQVLPLPRGAVRRRRLNMVATKMETPPVVVPATIVRTDVSVEGDGSKSIKVKQRKKKERKGEEGRNLQLRPGYMYREANWEIGRAAERAKVKVKEYKSKDRWTAWRKANAEKAALQEKKNLGRKIKAAK